MNDQLQQALAATINKANGGIDAGVNFLQAQLPDVVHQLLMWKAIYSGISMALATLIVVLTTAVHLKIISAFKRDGKHFLDHPELMALFLGDAILIVVAVALFNTDWLQILIAPKLYLIEYAAHLTRK